MTKTGKIVLSVVIFLSGTILLAISKSIAPHAGWSRIIIGVGSFALLMWIWSDKAQTPDKK